MTREKMAFEIFSALRACRAASGRSFRGSHLFGPVLDHVDQHAFTGPIGDAQTPYRNVPLAVVRCTDGTDDKFAFRISGQRLAILGARWSRLYSRLFGGTLKP